MTGWRKRQVMEMALEALKDACGGRCNAEYNPCFQREAITAIKEALAQPEERNFCPRCGKRAGDYIHTCTPPQEKYTYGTPLMDAIKGKP